MSAARPAAARAALPVAALALPFALSGAGALTLEVTWMRRLALVAGSTAVATTLVLSVYMAGLGLGALAGGRWRPARPVRAYAGLEVAAATWALAFPVLARLVEGLPPGAQAAALLLAPGLAHGATLPVLAGALRREGRAGVAALYAWNTAGAVAGTLLVPWLWMPLLGLTGTERVGAGLALLAAALAASRVPDAASPLPAADPVPRAGAPGDPPPRVVAALVAAGAAGFVGMGLEVAWSRLGALLLGASVYAFALVLAVFLLGTAAGAALGGRSRRVEPGLGLAALGVLAALGTAAWGQLPYGLAMAYDAAGRGAVLPAGALLVAGAMGGAPVASGLVFAHALRLAGPDPDRAAGRVLLANTAGAVAGAAVTGLVLVPGLGLHRAARALAALAVGAAFLAGRRDAQARKGRRTAATGLVLALSLPGWDPAIYAVGLFGQLDRFADLSPRAVHRFAHEGWKLLMVRDGLNATVAVGEGLRSGTRWLSIDGKVDASTGRDMPTQRLSARIPLAFAGPEPDVLVVGLASGVTAGEALAAGAGSLTVVELEPAVVEAAGFFASVNHDVLRNPATRLVLDDARAVLRREERRYDVIVSEPSNPWLAGVGSLFTREYWRLARSRLRPGGVFCQWVQLYSLPPSALRGLVRTFAEVFGRAWLFETIPGADALLVAAPGPLPAELPLEPRLDPDGVRRLGAVGRLHTDDDPWIEFEAPRWLLRETARANEALIEQAAR